MSETTDDQPNEHRLVTRIEGEEVRLLVHIEPITPAGDAATTADEGGQGEPDDGSGLTQ